jgi:hypothetical protein
MAVAMTEIQHFDTKVIPAKIPCKIGRTKKGLPRDIGDG